MDFWTSSGTERDGADDQTTEKEQHKLQTLKTCIKNIEYQSLLYRRWNNNSNLILMSGLKLQLTGSH